ncbi:MAG: hypothetical protein QG578_1979 [Thermodesulfobacteriota bacterium]|nr:hypothetical protein [Thermodesulfobacteriota bacterium]
MEKQILLVDDEEDIRDVLGVYLKSHGYEVHSAENGEEALKLFRKYKPPVVLSDIKMPGIDGIELLRKIKHESLDTEFIMITGHGDMDLAIASFQDHAADFITKPINVNILDVALKKVREKIVSRRQLREYTENLERLIKEKSELQDNLSALGLMLGTISHSIKGLLTGLDGGMYLVDSGFKKENLGKIAEGWTVVKEMVGHIRKLIQDILFYSKDREMCLEKVDVCTFAEETAKVIEPKILNRHIEFLKDFDSSAGLFEIDSPAVNSAIINILENAVDACIRDISKPLHRIIFSARQDDNRILFEVSDNGTGMDQETIDRLFTLFFSTKGKEGTGFGLFIADRIIRKHGGSIEVKSKPGHGTQFKIKIPVNSSVS